MKNLHNFTVGIFNKHVASQRKAYKGNPNPYIHSPLSRIVSPSNPITMTYQIIYSDDLSEIISYCRKENHALQEANMGLLHWILPFTFPIWIVCLILLAIPGFVTYYHTKSVSDSVSVLIGVLGVALKQYTNVIDKKLLVFTSFFGLIVCSFYETQITSSAMAQLPLPIIQSLEELIRKGYKLLITRETLIGDYELDFKFRNMLDVFNKSWYTYASLYDDYASRTDLEVILLANSNGSAAYAEIKDKKAMQYNLWFKTELLRNHTGDFEYACYSIPDQLKISQDYWRTNVKNRHWLQLSLSYMNAAGLPQIWDGWSVWVDRLYYMMEERYLREEGDWLGDSLFHKKELGPALIKIHELGGLLLLAICPVIISIVLLVLEICKHRAYNKNLNKKPNSIYPRKTGTAISLKYTDPASVITPWPNPVRNRPAYSIQTWSGKPPAGEPTNPPRVVMEVIQDNSVVLKYEKWLLEGMEGNTVEDLPVTVPPKKSPNDRIPHAKYYGTSVRFRNGIFAFICEDLSFSDILG
ncbi:unnamed protein product [Orchesella dallaii]|uniref:Uncharacterized protein n=1 Tax=Orchesella dallaii TaxID=48710 RepID=A0ABP1RLU3_9HEXA